MKAKLQLLARRPVHRMLPSPWKEGQEKGVAGIGQNNDILCIWVDCDCCHLALFAHLLQLEVCIYRERRRLQQRDRCLVSHDAGQGGGDQPPEVWFDP